MQEPQQDGSIKLATGWNPTNKALFTFDEASSALSLSRGMLFKLARTGRLKVVKIGRSARIPQDEIQRLVSGESLGGVQ